MLSKIADVAVACCSGGRQRRAAAISVMQPLITSGGVSCSSIASSSTAATNVISRVSSSGVPPIFFATSAIRSASAERGIVTNDAASGFFFLRIDGVLGLPLAAIVLYVNMGNMAGHSRSYNVVAPAGELVLQVPGQTVHLAH